MSQIALTRRMPKLFYLGARACSGEYGSGAGRGGGTGGSIRDAGGAFGKREAANEEKYIRKLQQEQLKALKHSLSIEVEFHKEQIEAHKKALERHRERLEEMKNTEKKTEKD